MRIETNESRCPTWYSFGTCYLPYAYKWPQNRLSYGKICRWCHNVGGVIYFGWQELTLPHLKIGESAIERVLMINTKHDHVEYISSKASCRIYFQCILRRAGKPPTDIIHVYTSVIRSVLEYACEVWHCGLTKRTIWHSGTPPNIQTLYQRREAKCCELFAAMERPTHKLHHLLPKEQNKSNLRTFQNKVREIKKITNHLYAI